MDRLSRSLILSIRLMEGVSTIGFNVEKETPKNRKKEMGKWASIQRRKMENWLYKK